jgi:hypothetical protein
MKFFFHEHNKKSKELLDRIKVACQDLIYISEIDSPVMPYAAAETNTKLPGVLLEYTGRLPNDDVEQASFKDLFDRLTAKRDWHGERENQRTKKFLELRELLEEYLTDLKVFRLGRIQIDIFAVGFDQNHILMGVSTKAVET